MDKKRLVGYSPWRHKESDTTEWNFHFHIFEIINVKRHSQYNSTFMKCSWKIIFKNTKEMVVSAFPLHEAG